MPCMAKRKTSKKEDGDAKRPNRVGVSLHVYITPELAEALERFTENSEPKVSKTAAVETALLKLLREAGELPPKGGRS